MKRGQVLVVGHSEGGHIACRVAKDLPGIVTHVACAAGCGPTFLFDIIMLARRGAYFGEVSDKPEERVQYVLDEWRRIQAEPMNTKKRFFGHSYRYWAACLASSPMEHLEKVDAKIYIAQGTEDKAVDPVSADVLHAHPLARVALSRNPRDRRRDDPSGCPPSRGEGSAGHSAENLVIHLVIPQTINCTMNRSTR